MDFLTQGFDYDRWANRIWAKTLIDFDLEILSPTRMTSVNQTAGWPPFTPPASKEKAGEVFTHLLWAQRTWLSRCRPDIQIDPNDVFAAIDTLSAAWKETMPGHDLEEVIVYKNTTGQEHRRHFGEIVRHVQNHGTYHRGQLREIAEAIGVQPVPDTDLIGFFIREIGTR